MPCLVLVNSEASDCPGLYQFCPKDLNLFLHNHTLALILLIVVIFGLLSNTAPYFI